jgi:hypothetical protein
MNTLEQAVSIVGAIVGGIIVLTIFFKVMGWLSDRANLKLMRIRFQGVLDENTRATVHLTSGASLENVRLAGFTEPGAVKGPFPFELRGMVILEHADGRRIMLSPKLIRMIEVPPVDS